MSKRERGTSVWGALAGKARWSETDARALVDAWLESGRTIEAFARDAGIGAWKLRYWSSKLSTEKLSRSRRRDDEQRLVPAVLTVGGKQGGPMVVVRLPDGIEVELHDVAQVEVEEIGRLVASLRRSCS